jgi:hypothetical protein
MAQDESNKTTETSDAEEAARRERRRAFLRGAAAIPPAIVTLSSGSAWAVSGTCFSRLPSTQRDAVLQETNRGQKLQRLRDFNISLNCWNSGNLTDPL